MIHGPRTVFPIPLGQDLEPLTGRVAAWSLRHRWWVVGAWLVLTLVGAVATAGAGIDCRRADGATVATPAVRPT